VSNWVAACAVEDVDEEDVIGFSHEGEDYALYRSDDDEFFASDGHCTHERTLLCDGLVLDGIVECPKHNGRFDYRTGGAKGAPVLENLRMYPVKVDDGTVYVDLG
jgi:3-phenylpropionate/trans-cinnamate dioxygenase ferredoxin component